MTSKTCFVLLPGNMCDDRMWSLLLPQLQHLHFEHHLPRGATIAQMADDCLQRFEGKLVLIGFSMGAIIALAMANIAPDRIAALCLLDTNAGPDLPERSDVRLRQQADVKAGHLKDVVMEELKPAYFAQTHRSNSALLELVLDMAMSLGTDVFVDQSEALRTRSDLRHVLPGLDVPVFVACGEEDTLCPPSLHAELAKSSETCVFHKIAGAGHFLPLEQPKRLAGVLYPWLDSIDS